MRKPIVLGLTFLFWGCTTAEVPGTAEQDVRALDELERHMVAASDAAALDELAHPNLRINAPIGRVLTREEFLSNVRSGRISAEQFERTAESVTISGSVATVMGHETFTPQAASELGQIYGSVPLKRRYTNIYIWEKGRWRWLARHANVVHQTASMHAQPPSQ